MAVLGKNGGFGSKWLFLVQIAILVNMAVFGQNGRFWSKWQFLVQNCPKVQKSKILLLLLLRLKSPAFIWAYREDFRPRPFDESWLDHVGGYLARLSVLFIRPAYLACLSGPLIRPANPEGVPLTVRVFPGYIPHTRGVPITVRVFPGYIPHRQDVPLTVRVLPR